MPLLDQKTCLGSDVNGGQQQQNILDSMLCAGNSIIHQKDFFLALLIFCKILTNFVKLKIYRKKGCSPLTEKVMLHFF